MQKDIAERCLFCLRERIAVRALGTAPLGRGKGLINHLIGDTGGIIPAHAGKSYANTAFTFLCEDHPRSCGEKTAASFA